MPHERKRAHTETMNADASSFSCRFPAEGTDFGRYCNMRLIGEGGMGRVYLAFDPMLNIELAVKVVPRGIHSSEEERRRFKREIQLLAAINIPGVVRLFDCGECDGWQYYTMEYVDGAAIDDYANGRNLSQKERLRLILSLAETLGELHSSDIIHRDLKPSNVLVTEDGSVRLTDFGIAKSFDRNQNQSAITLNDTRPGTPFYMSPESSARLRDRAIAKKADVYSLGVMAYELLTGRLPYDVENLSPTECVLVIREEQPCSFAERRTIIAPEIETIIMATLEKEPEKRPSARSLAEMLKRGIGGEPISTTKQKSRRWPLAVAATVLGATLLLLHMQMIRNRPRSNQGAEAVDTSGAGAKTIVANGDVIQPDDTSSTKTDADTTAGSTAGTDTSDTTKPLDSADPTPHAETPKRRFEKILARADLALVKQEWKTAQTAYAELRTIPGFETCTQASTGIRKATCGRLMDSAHAAAKRKEWTTVRDQANEVLKLNPKHVEAAVLLMQASDALIPRATLSTWYNGLEVTGVTLLVNGAILEQTTPMSCRLDQINGKSITLLAPRTPTVVYKPYHLEWNDLPDNSLKVELEAQTVVVAQDVNMDMIPISKGTFDMGDDKGSSRARPRHEVTLSYYFWMSEYEVTQDQYYVIMRSNPARIRGQKFPIVSISWCEAVAFCKTLTAREEQAGRVPEGYVYRLPTEAEWEYCCRAGTTGAYPFEGGKTLPSRIASKESNLKQYAEVGYGKSNEWGLFNLNGNVREWVLDTYAGYPKGPVTDPVAHSRSSARIVRGGSWARPLKNCTSSCRDRSMSGRKHFYDVGFRVALAPPVK